MASRDTGSEDVIVTNQNGPGLWFFARYAILKHHCFSEKDAKNGEYQRKLVIWLRDKYFKMLEDSDTKINRLNFKLNSKITIPSKEETAQIIGVPYYEEMVTDCGEILIGATLSSIQILDMENKEIKEKWVIEKQVRICVQCKNASDQTKICIEEWRRDGNEGSTESIKLSDDDVESEGDGKYTAVWKYKYGWEELTGKPHVYFTAKIKGEDDEISSETIELSMEIRIVVVDHNDVLVIEDKPNNPIIEIKFEAKQENDKGEETEEIAGKPDSKGEYRLGGLTPCTFDMRVKAPIERKYTDEKIPAASADENLIEINEIDGSKTIAYGSGGEYNFELGKTNVIKLPVRYLDSGEIDLIRKILGDMYFNTTIKIECIQIIKRNPTEKQLRELCNYFNIPIPSEFTPAAIHDLITDRGMSLPNDIIYLYNPNNSPLEMDALLVHEAFHQYQYKEGGEQAVFFNLIDEARRYALGDDVYVYDRYAGVTQTMDISSLHQITTLEGRAKFLEHFTLAFKGFRPAIYRLSDYKPAMLNKSGSGISTNVQ
jgi:hypothetical protein